MTLKNKFFIALGLIAFAVAGRFVPHLWNLTPVAAVALLSGARLGFGWGIAVPLSVMAITDPILGLTGLPMMLTIYLAFILPGVIGYFARNSSSTAFVLGGSFASTIFFYLSTNAAVWMFTSMYPHNLAGLIASYVAGLPFVMNQIVGDLFFTAALLTIWEFGKVFAVRMKTNKMSLSGEKVF